MRVLVLGAGGFVGVHVVDDLVASGHEVVAAVQPGSSRVGLRTDLETVEIDAVLEPQNLRGVLDSGVDALVNAAGRVTGSRSELVSANALLVAEVLDALTRVPAARRPRLVHVGSAAEYGPPAGRNPVTTDHPAVPAGSYAASKLCGTMLAVGAFRSGEASGTVIRLFNPIGPGSPPATLAGAAARRIGSAIDRDETEIEFGDLDAERDFIDVRDAAALFSLACSHQGPLPELLNAGTGVARPGRDVVEALMRAAGWTGRVVDGGPGSPRSSIRWQAADIGLAQQALGWSPRRSLKEAAEDLWAEERRAVLSRTVAR